MAQQKPVTLNDVLWGGTNYWNLQPQRLYTAWWGDQLIALDAEEAHIFNTDKAQREAGALFTTADINRHLNEATDGRVVSLYQATFPYADQSLVLLQTNKAKILYDFREDCIEWSVAREAGTSHNDFNAPSRREAFVKDNNLFVRLADNSVQQISHDGTRELVYGQSVHRDEFGITKGTYWSPKGALLAFYRMDQSMVADYPQVDIEHRIAQYVPDKYPMAGETSHKVTVGVYNPEKRTTVYLQTGDPTDRYFSNISWSPDERTIYLFEAPRTQDEAVLAAYDAETGKRLRTVYTERHAKYVEPQHPIEFLPWDDNAFLLQSQRDGYNHLYLFDVRKGEVKQLTKGAFVVLDVAGFNEKTRSVIVQSNERHPLRANYYAVNVKTGKRTLLDNGEGVHNATLSPSGNFLSDAWTSPSVPSARDLLSTAKNAPRRLLTSADPMAAQFRLPEITCGSIKADDGKTDLYYRLVKPTNFDPTKKYPAVVYVYGGPHARNVRETYHYDTRGWEIYMAEKGYVVYVLDNRGSSERGLEFENATFRQLGEVEMRDQMRGVDFLRSLPYVDASRLGVHGWSFGGFMTINLLLTHPDVFKVGVAGGPVIDWKYYEVMYGERYMDTPQENPEGYAQSSLLNKAKNLKGRLQIILGYNDPTCVPQHTLSFLRACIDADTQPDLFLYPNQGHNMNGHDRIHLHERITRYFEDYLKPLQQP